MFEIMIRLHGQEQQHTGRVFDKIFYDRQARGLQADDRRRYSALLSHFKKSGRLLDLGALDSLVPVMAKERFPQTEVWAFDHAEEAMKRMQEAFPSIRCRVGDLHHTGFEDNYFDYVVLGEVLEHLERPWEAVAEIRRILKPGGIVAISVPYNEAREPGAVDVSHIWSYKKHDMEDLLQGFKLTKFQRLRSQWWPRYQYRWPTLITFAQKI